VRTEVSVDDRASPTHTVIEVFAKDRPGLLFSLARAFRDLGLQIALSKINTEGSKVADVFYVTELDGTKVAVGDRSKYVRQALLSCLEDASEDPKPSSRGTPAAQTAQGTPEV
jgi:[protein-PII] uridylyltransferase